MQIHHKESVPPTPKTGASVFVTQENKMLLIKRGKQPYEGFWAFPGGSQEWGERLEDTAKRELLEETGLIAAEIRFLEFTDRIARNENSEISHHFLLGVFHCLKFEGQAVAGDDAADIGWFSLEEACNLPTTPNIVPLATRFLSDT